MMVPVILLFDEILTNSFARQDGSTDDDDRHGRLIRGDHQPHHHPEIQSTVWKVWRWYATPSPPSPPSPSLVFRVSDTISEVFPFILTVGGNWAKGHYTDGPEFVGDDVIDHFRHLLEPSD